MNTITSPPSLTYQLEVTVKDLEQPYWRFSVVHRNNRTCYYSAYSFKARADRLLLPVQKPIPNIDFWRIRVFADPLERSDGVYEVTTLCAKGQIPSLVRSQLRTALLEAGVPPGTRALDHVLGV